MEVASRTWMSQVSQAFSDDLIDYFPDFLNNLPEEVVIIIF